MKAEATPDQCSGRYYNFKKGFETCLMREYCRLYEQYVQRENFYDYSSLPFPCIKAFRTCLRFSK